MKVRELAILRRLEEVFKVEDVKYNIISKTFIYTQNNSTKEITFYTLLSTLKDMDLTDDQRDLYNILKSLNASYFPRRLKQLFIGLYHHADIPLPNDLYITQKGVRIEQDSSIKYIKYDDDWNKMIQNFEKIFDIPLENKEDILNFDDFKGEYHQSS